MSNRRIALLAALIVLVLPVVACTPKAPTGSTTPPASATSPAPASATPAVSAAQPVATPISYTPIVDEASVSYPEGNDPVLGTRKWGTRSQKVKSARGQAVTASRNVEVEGFENDTLTEQQASELLDLFSDSAGVHRLITRFGGDPHDDETEYYVKEIDANEDHAGTNTPWVTATLRADFASPEGKRGIEMQVYRKKLDWDTLDNTPYISLTQVSYLNSEGELSTAIGYPAGHKPDELQTIRFKN